MNLNRSLGVSLSVLFGQKLRTLLSAVAVGTGVAAVVMMVGAGKAAQQDTMKKIQNLGTDLITVSSGKFKSIGGRMRHVARYTTLIPKDARQIEKNVKGIKTIGGYLDNHVEIIYKNTRTRTEAQGVEPQVFGIWRMYASSGRLYDQKDEFTMARVCVLGPTVKTNLFLDKDPVGETIKVSGIPLKVIGVSTPRGQDIDGDDQDDVIYVPLQTAMKRIFNVIYIENLLVQTTDRSVMDDVKEGMAKVLRKNHRLKEGKEDDFTIQDQSQLLSTEMETEQAFTFLVAIVAGLSLFTGGIGIFAVMLISLRERRREVGLRRAIGARHRDILVQFLLEASMLSVMGGVVGEIIGFIGCYIICRSYAWEPVLPVSTAAGAFIVSLLTGVVFGISPARKASKLDPAESLRAAA
jgi:putative ABC transport system permease protein